MKFRPYIEMIRRSKDRIEFNLSDYKENDTRIALVHIGLELRQIQTIIDEAFTSDNINYYSFHLLTKWYYQYYKKITHDIIWL